RALPAWPSPSRSDGGRRPRDAHRGGLRQRRVDRPDPLTVVRIACLLGLIEKSATAAILVAVIPRRAIGYDGHMGFFNAPPPPPRRRPLPQPPPPEWMAAPEGWLGGFVPVRPVLARTEEVVITLEQLEAFPTGVRFELTVVTRRPFVGVSAVRWGIGGGGIRLGVAFPDGSKW